MKISAAKWFSSGTPFVWLNAGAVAISILMVVGLLGLLAVRGMAHFWPADVMQANYAPPVSFGSVMSTEVLGERVETESVSSIQIASSGIPVDESIPYYDRELVKLGNRDVTGADFAWLLSSYLSNISYPADVVALERREWGNFYGFLTDVRETGESVVAAAAEEEALWVEFEQRLSRALDIHDEIYRIEKIEIGEVNYALERLRLRQRGLELKGEFDAETEAIFAQQREELGADYALLQQDLVVLNKAIERDSALFLAANGAEVDIELADIVRAYKPNQMGLLDKLFTYFAKLGEFLTDEPREANTEGGIFPAIFGTVMMVLLMSVFVTPFGVVAAVYLREYARQGFVTRAIRIAVNNLAGVPSIVYGVFGLGFFIYIIGAEVDQLFYPEALPAPTFGTPGLLWASLTLALLTVPVVIVATEEGLARIPRSVREGSLALGA
ncbi:MAG TPA: phosphate ABC transporter, permease protein PstA, partial [Gammaproteobacteria bacterium]|nr:phosphate ABC transporter, permease protein PstA [Gammaproteobacteria bacterium]